MKIHLLSVAFAGALAASVTLVAQNPPPQQSAPRTPTAQDPARPSVTVEGCVMREADVPGRRPNIAERAGIGEDYILTTTKMVKGSAPAASSTVQSRPGQNPGTPAAGQTAMYKIVGLDADVVKQHAGRRVQIDGTFENVDRAAGTTENLVELRGTALRQIAATCSAN